MLPRLNPFVRFAGVVTADICPDKPYCVGDSRLFYCRRGKATLTVCGIRYEIASGALVYIPPYELYGFSDFSSDEDFVMVTVNFDFDQSRCDVRKTLAKIPADAEYDRAPLFIPEQFSSAVVLTDGGFVRDELDGMVSLFFSKEKFYRDMSSAYLKCILLKLLGAERQTSDSPAARVLSYISKNYGKRMSNADIAREFNYHPNHLNRIIKAHTGKTLQDYMIYYRVKVSKRLLASTTLTVTEISEECGFSTPSYFSEIFLREEGVTPREYRRNIRSTVI